MSKIVNGVIHGKTIELDQESGLPDGQTVEVAIQIVQAGLAPEPWGEGLRRCAGALADIPGLDEDMEQILQERKTATFREVPD
jgi:citrate lyase beta subunit